MKLYQSKEKSNTKGKMHLRTAYRVLKKTAKDIANGTVWDWIPNQTSKNVGQNNYFVGQYRKCPYLNEEILNWITIYDSNRFYNRVFPWNDDVEIIASWVWQITQDLKILWGNLSIVWNFNVGNKYQDEAIQERGGERYLLLLRILGSIAFL